MKPIKRSVRSWLVVTALACVFAAPSVIAQTASESKANCDDLSSRVSAAQNAAIQARMPESSAGAMMDDMGIGDILATKINFFSVLGFDSIMDVFSSVGQIGSDMAARAMGGALSKMTGNLFRSGPFLDASKYVPMGSAQAMLQSGVQSGIVTLQGEVATGLNNVISGATSSGSTSAMTMQRSNAQGQFPAGQIQQQPGQGQPQQQGFIDRMKNWFR